MSSHHLFVALRPPRPIRDLLRGAMRMACRDAVAALRPEQVAEDFDRILRSLAHHGGAHVAAAATP